MPYTDDVDDPQGAPPSWSGAVLPFLLRSHLAGISNTQSKEGTPPSGFRVCHRTRRKLTFSRQQPCRCSCYPGLISAVQHNRPIIFPLEKWLALPSWVVLAASGAVQDDAQNTGYFSARGTGVLPRGHSASAAPLYSAPTSLLIQHRGQDADATRKGRREVIQRDRRHETSRHGF